MYSLLFGCGEKEKDTTDQSGTHTKLCSSFLALFARLITPSILPLGVTSRKLSYIISSSIDETGCMFDERKERERENAVVKESFCLIRVREKFLLAVIRML